MNREDERRPERDSGEREPEPPPSAPAGPALTEELAAIKDRLLRCLADQENVRRLSRRERDEAVRYAASGFARDLLPAADSLERAIASVPEARRQDPDMAALMAGIEATRRMLLDAFARHGLQRLEPLGEPFDPFRHQASFEVADPRFPRGHITEVVQPGYVHHDRLLRPALVGVSSGPAERPEELAPDR